MAYLANNVLTTQKAKDPKKLDKRLLVLVIAIPIILLLIFGLSKYGIVERLLCGGELLESFQSPNGTIIASVYQFNCGATTNFSTRIALRKAFQKWDVYSKKVIFVQEGEPSEHKISIVWRDETHLDIYLAHLSQKTGWWLTEYLFAGKTFTIDYFPGK